MVRAGTSATFQVQGQATGWFPPNASDLRAGVIAYLSGYFNVQSVELNVASTTARILGGNIFQFDYTAIVTVLLRGDYGSVNDVGSVVAHAFYVAGGSLPTVTTDLRDTGIGGVNEEEFNPGGIGDSFKKMLDSISSLPTLLVAGIIIVVAVVVFSPAGKAAGRAGVRVSAT